jgi:hypothetical protein
MTSAEYLQRAKLMAQAKDDGGEVDEFRLAELFDLAGQEVAPELAQRLMDDLGNVATALSARSKDLDSMGIRAQSHVLLALSGTIGAEPVYRAATRLNAFAHAGDTEALAGALQETLGLLERLQARLLPFLSGRLGPS